jgi:hypothetical protein
MNNRNQDNSQFTSELIKLGLMGGASSVPSTLIGARAAAHIFLPAPPILTAIATATTFGLTSYVSSRAISTTKVALTGNTKKIPSRDDDSQAKALGSYAALSSGVSSLVGYGATRVFGWRYIEGLSKMHPKVGIIATTAAMGIFAASIPLAGALHNTVRCDNEKKRMGNN